MEKSNNNNLAKKVAAFFSNINLPLISGFLVLFKDSFKSTFTIPKNISDNSVDAYFEKKLLQKIQKNNNESKTAIYEAIKSKDVEQFLDTLESKMNSENYQILYNNMVKKLNIYSVSGLSLKMLLLYMKNVVGLFRIKNNTILYLSYEKRTTLIHELVHAFTALIDRKKYLYCCGFHRSYSPIPRFNYVIGVGLNEGYTQLFVSKYFPNNCSFAYDSETKIAKLLEFVVEPDRLEKYFVSTDLPGLINELKQYSNEEDSIKFIKNIDKLFRANKKYSFKNTNSKRAIRERLNIQSLEVQIYTTLVYWILKVNYKKYDEKLITEEKIKNIIDQLKYRMPYEESLNSIFTRIYLDNIYRTQEPELIPNIYKLFNIPFIAPEIAEENPEDILKGIVA